MARIVQIVLTDPTDNPLEASTTGYWTVIPAAIWDSFLERMVKRNFDMGEALTYALEQWSASDEEDVP